jgi:hypothetical protein
MPSSKTQKFWFSVGTPRSHATVWRLFSPLPKGDVYLGPRYHAGTSKLSIHGSGVRHLRVGGPNDFGQSVPEGTPIPAGQLFRWVAPRPHPGGHEIAWRILTPAGHLRDARLDPKFKGRVTWVPPAPVGHCIDFAIMLFPEHVKGVHMAGDVPTRFLTRWRLGNGETLLLIARIVPLTSEHFAMFSGELDRVRLPTDWQEEEVNKEHDYRMHAYSVYPELGFYGCYDLAYDFQVPRAEIAIQHDGSATKNDPAQSSQPAKTGE